MRYKPKWKAYQVAVREHSRALAAPQIEKMIGDADGPTHGRERRMYQWAQWKLETLAKREFPNAEFTLANTEARVAGHTVTFYQSSKLSRPETDRLAKICGMFGSEFDGERSAAATMADRLIKSANLTWQNLFGNAADAKELISIRIPHWVDN